MIGPRSHTPFAASARAAARAILLALAAILVSGCLGAQMNRQPDRWVTVLDVETGKPVPDLGLHYEKVPPYLIVGTSISSREYKTDSAGRAHVPSGENMRPSWTSTYQTAGDLQDHRDDVVYVRDTGTAAVVKTPASPAETSPQPADATPAAAKIATDP